MFWKSLEEQIQSHRLRSPESIAIDASSFNNLKISYSQLECLVTALTKFLQEKSVRRGDRVALVCEYRLNTIVAYLALFRLGLSVITLDFNDKESRRKEMITSLNVRWFLTDKGLKHTGGDFPKNYNIKQLLTEEIKHKKNPDFIFFSSGSTNRPKAIGGTHQAFEHYINWQINCFKLQPGLRFSQLTLLHYDACLRDIFGSLCSGGTLCLPAQNNFNFTANELTQWILKNKINIINTVPSIFSLLVTQNQSEPLSNTLQYLFLAGERINPQDLRKWYSSNTEKTKIVNLYGATETLMTKLFYIIHKSDINKKSIPVGRAMDQVQVEIISQQKGITINESNGSGQIRITVPYLLPGYINYTDQGQFEYDYSRKRTHYNTGDIGRFNNMGDIEFIGRTDRQIKINGIRLDLDEVETTVSNFDPVDRCAALFCNNIVSCFIVLTGKNISNIQPLLQENFSNHFSAIKIEVLDELPVTKTGKIDYSSLRKQSSKSLIQDLTPENKHSLTQDDDLISLKLRIIWADILNLNIDGVISLNDNFFDNGGDSLACLQFISAIESTFSKKISISEFVNHASLAQLNSLLRRQKNYINSPIVTLNSEYPKSSSDSGQSQGFWCLHAPGGSIVPYATLARKFKNQSFKGIQYPTFCGDPDINSVEALADYYMQYMLKQPGTKQHDSYNLGAWSSGSIFALELASRLIKKGHQVPVIILIDSPMHYRKNENKQQYKIRTFSSILGYLAQGLDIIPEQKKNSHNSVKELNFEINPNHYFIMNLVASHFLDMQFSKQELGQLVKTIQITDTLIKDYIKIKPWVLSIFPKSLILKLSPARREKILLFFLNIGRTASKNYNKESVLQYMDVFRKNMQAIFKYDLNNINMQFNNTRIVLLTQEKFPELSGWKQLGFDIEVKHIPGNHFTVFKEPNVALLADMVKQELTHIETMFSINNKINDFS